MSLMLSTPDKQIKDTSIREIFTTFIQSNNDGMSCEGKTFQPDLGVSGTVKPFRCMLLSLFSFRILS